MSPGWAPLQTTALANEAWMRLVDLDRVQWQDRAHLFAMASRTMRRVLDDAARADHARLGFAVSIPEAADVVALDDALTALERVDRRKCLVVELRFFGGLSVEETARALDVSEATVARDWTCARTWLRRELTPRSRPSSRGAGRR